MTILLLYNPRSGKGERSIRAIVALFGEVGHEVEALRIEFEKNPFDERSPDRVVVAGGDGTVNWVVNRMKERGLDRPIGIVPTGTANDFALALGMARDPLRAARQILDGHEQRIDCGRANECYFVNIFSFGIFTTTSQRTPDERKRRLGKLAYIIEGARELRTMHGIPLQVAADGQRFEFEALMALVFNGETAGGFRIAPRSSLRDGLFDCLLLQRRGGLRSILAMVRHLAGGRSAAVKHFRARCIEITSTIDEPTDVDGQQGTTFPLRIECLPGALRVVCP